MAQVSRRRRWRGGEGVARRLFGQEKGRGQALLASERDVLRR